MQNATISPKKSYKKLLSLLLVAVLIAGSLYLSKSGFFKGNIFLGSGAEKLTITTTPNLLVNPTLTIDDTTYNASSANVENPKIILGKETIFNFQVGTAIAAISLNKNMMANSLIALGGIGACGNEILDEGEAFDGYDDEDNTNICTCYPGYTLVNNACTPTTPPSTTNLCGNGILDEGEAFDGIDEDTSSDMCTCAPEYTLVNNTCTSTTPPPSTTSICGNGIVETGEECDTNADNSSLTESNKACNSSCQTACANGFELVAERCEVIGDPLPPPLKKVKFTVNTAILAATMKKNGESLGGQNDVAGYNLEGADRITSFSFQATTVPDTAFNTDGILEDALTITYINETDEYNISFDLVKDDYACGNLIGTSEELIGSAESMTSVLSNITTENAKADLYTAMGYACTTEKWTSEESVTKKIGETIDLAGYDNLLNEIIFEDQIAATPTIFQAKTIGQALAFKDSEKKYKIINIIAQDTQPPASPVCGNNIKEETESCDGTALGGITCTNYGLTGTVSCSSTCTLNVSNCLTAISSGGGGGGGGGTIILSRSNRNSVRNTSAKGTTASSSGSKTERRVAVEFLNISLPSKNLKFDSKIATQFFDVKNTFFLKDVIYNMSKIRYGKQQRPLIVGIIKMDEFGQPIVKNGKIVKEFKPNQTMDMAQYLKVLLGAMDFENSKYCDLKDAGYKKAMREMPAIEGWAGTELRRLLIGAINAGIMTKADLASLYNPMSRGAAVKILIKLKTAVDEVKLAKFDAKKSVFKDVKTANKDADYIYTAETLGLSNVFTDSNTFDSTKKITRADGINAIYKLYLSADLAKDAAPTTKKKTTESRNSNKLSDTRKQGNCDRAVLSSTASSNCRS
jgi:hypothetical protein